MNSSAIFSRKEQTTTKYRTPHNAKNEEQTILRHYGVGMIRTEFVNVFDRIINIVDHFDTTLQISIFDA